MDPQWRPLAAFPPRGATHGAEDLGGWTAVLNDLVFVGAAPRASARRAWRVASPLGRGSLTPGERCRASGTLAPRASADALGGWAVPWDVARLPRCVASQRAVDSLTYQAYWALSWSRVLQVGGLPLMPFAFLLPPQLHVVFHIPGTAAFPPT